MTGTKISALPAAGALTGAEPVPAVQGGATVQTTTAAIAALASSPTGANPTAAAGPAAVNGSAGTFMRSDAAPAVQKGTNAVFGVVQGDGATVTIVAGVVSTVATPPTGANPTATAGPTAVNGSAGTFMRSDAAPAVQSGSAAQKGIVQVDGATITAAAGVISGPLLNFYTALPNVDFKRGQFNSMIIGDNDLYTCPANRRAIIGVVTISAIAAGGNVVNFPEVKISGTYYQLDGNTNAASGNTTTTLAAGYVLEAGETFAINAASHTNAVAFFDIIEFDNTALLKCVKLAGTVNGNNTIYTCPANHSAILLRDMCQSNSPLLAGGAIQFVPDPVGSGSTVTYVVPNGGSAATTNQTKPAATPSTSTRNILVVPATLTAGDFVVLNVTTGNAAQYAYLFLIESPNT